MLLLFLACLDSCGSAPAPAPAAPEARAPAGQPAPPGAADPPWLEEAVSEGLDMLTMPGTTPPEPGGAEAAELRAFFLAHPEYSDPALRQQIADAACAFGLQRAHEMRLSPPPKEPLLVELPEGDWRLVLMHADHWCTSDDWAAFTSEVSDRLKARGVLTEGAGAGHDQLVLRQGGKELARHPIHGQGYLALRPGAPPVDLGHQMVEDVMPPLSEALQLHPPLVPAEGTPAE
jgi:hypothetical protein